MASEVEKSVLQNLSHARLRSYLYESDDDLSKALHLYLWNQEISSALLEVIGCVEIVTRNAWHRQLRSLSNRLVGHEFWFDNQFGLLRVNSTQRINEARRRLAQQRREDHPNQVVAELNFGFWRFLFAKQYRTTLWPLAGKYAFPNLEPSQINELSRVMGRLHDLRNRTAHHEPIHARNLGQDFADCLWVIGGVCMTTRDWTMKHSRVTHVLGNRPKLK